MLRKVLATAALTASAAGVMAVPAVASGGTSGHDAKSEFGSTEAGGKDSPTMSILQGALNDPCVGIGRLNANSLLLILNIGIQDVPVLSQQHQSQCTENSVIQDGDAALSHLLDRIPVVSGNGSGGR
ncbi:rodlin [Streptomyces sp. NPDC002536]|uniref:rodlin n=1 Tax=Streptomyces sp. NPDC001262 TaxID=3364552 RepID=UPI0036771CF7